MPTFPDGTTNLFSLKLTYTFQGKTNYNQFYYLADSSGGNALELATNWETECLPDIAAILSDEIVDFLVDVVNLGVNDDVYQVDSDLEGLREGNVLPRWVTWNFRYTTTNRYIRYGYKRFSGLCEGDVSNAATPESPIATLLADAATAMESLISGDTAEYAAVIPSPANLSHVTNVVQPINTCLFLKVGHQVSRE